MKLRPQWVLVVGAVVIFYGALAALKHRVLAPPQEEGGGEVPATEERQYEEDYARQRAQQVSRWEPEVLPRPFLTRQATKIVRLSEGEQGEGFETEKLRAFGEAWLTGTVRRPDRRPVPGAVVQLYDLDPMTKNPPLRESVTDTSGTYRLERINASERTYIMIVRAAGYAPYATFLNLRDPPVAYDVELSEGVEFAGVVIDAETSLPVPRATVYHPVRGITIYRPLGTVETTAMGEFRFADAPRGSVNVLVECPGYRLSKSTLTSPNNRATILLWAGGATIRGETVSRLTQKPVGPAKVGAIGQDGLIVTTYSDREGRFELRDMPPGNYLLVGYNGMPGLAEKIRLAPREVREGVRLILPSALFVSGRVVHAFSGSPLAGVKVYFLSPMGRKWVTSDENGLFGFETLALDDYWVEVHEKNFLPLLEHRTTTSQERITRKIRRSDASDQLTIRLRPVPCIEGVVMHTDRASHPTTPAAGITVSVATQQRDVRQLLLTQTDASGRFFVNLPSGRRGSSKVVVPWRNTLGYAKTRIPTRRPLTIELERQPRLAGALFLSDGTPLAGVEILATYFFPDQQDPSKAVRLNGGSTYVGTRGNFMLPLAPNEKVELTFVMPDGQLITKIFETGELADHRWMFVYDPVGTTLLVERGGAPPRGR